MHLCTVIYDIDKTHKDLTLDLLSENSFDHVHLKWFLNCHSLQQYYENLQLNLYKTTSISELFCKIAALKTRLSKKSKIYSFFQNIYQKFSSNHNSIVQVFFCFLKSPSFSSFIIQNISIYF